MKSTTKCAINFIIKNNPNKLSYNVLETYLKRQGFDIIRFAKGNPDVSELFIDMGINAEIAAKKCFTYINGDYRHVFLAEYLSEQECVFMLLHEIGHLELSHMQIDNIYKELDEQEANEFAVDVIHYVRNHSYYKAFIIFAVALLLAVLACFWGMAYVFKSSQKDVAISSALSSASAVDKTKPAEYEYDSGEEEIFYITKSGKKYHRYFCSVIKDKDNLLSGTREELENAGYEPCMLCIGDDE